MAQAYGQNPGVGVSLDSDAAQDTSSELSNMNPGEGLFRLP